MKDPDHKGKSILERHYGKPKIVTDNSVYCRRCSEPIPDFQIKNGFPYKEEKINKELDSYAICWHCVVSPFGKKKDLIDSIDDASRETIQPLMPT